MTNEPFTYDGYGRLSSETTPLFSFSSITYDDEGEPASYYSQWPPPYVSGTDTVTYTATGEDATTGFITWNETTPYFYFDGVPLANSDYSLQQSNIDGHNADSNTYPTFWDSSAGYIPIYNRPDSVTDFTAFFQGVRNYNSDTSQWSSSDQSAGSIDDPMSQAGYMWNNNNPFMYQDPTGYYTNYLPDCVGTMEGCGDPLSVTYSCCVPSFAPGGVAVVAGNKGESCTGVGDVPAPLGYTWSQVYNSGVADSILPPGLREAATAKNELWYGRYDFQRNSTLKRYGGFVSASNYGVGVFSAGIGLSYDEMLDAITAVSARNAFKQWIPDVKFASEGYWWAQQHCSVINNLVGG